MVLIEVSPSTAISSSTPPPREAINHAGYADAVLAELAARKGEMAGRRLATVFFGGGTPSLWEPAELARVLRAILSTFEADDSTVEVSLECDPSSLDRARARALVDVGIGRLSIGVQALDDEHLKFLGRIHTAREARDALGAAVEEGMPRVSADLIYAVAGQDAHAVAGEARELVQRGATHVSAYSLTIEPDTPFGSLARRGRLPLCDDGVGAATFFAIDEALVQLGSSTTRFELRQGGRAGSAQPRLLATAATTSASGAAPTAQSPAATAPRDATATGRTRARTSPRSRRATGRRRIGGAARSPTRLRERIMLGLRMKEGLDFEQAAADLGADANLEITGRAPPARGARRIVRRGARIAVPREAWIGPTIRPHRCFELVSSGKRTVCFR